MILLYCICLFILLIQCYQFGKRQCLIEIVNVKSRRKIIILSKFIPWEPYEIFSLQETILPTTFNEICCNTQEPFLIRINQEYFTKDNVAFLPHVQCQSITKFNYEEIQAYFEINESD